MDLLSPAKLNLFLYVVRRRPDGYHDLISLMVPVDLCDRIRIRFGGHGVRVVCADAQVPEDDSNLAARAAAAIQKALGARDGLEIDIEKRIPVGAGLGGGSSNAATVLIALNRHYGHPFTVDDLIPIAKGVGADVPFFIFGKPALATGIGDRLSPWTTPLPYHAVVVFPGFGMSTAEVYQGLNLGLTNFQNPPKQILLKENRFVPGQDLHNDLEAVVCQAFPQINELKAALMKAGAIGALMTGSGSGVFGLFPDADSAGQACRVLAHRGDGACFAVKLLTDAAEVCADRHDFVSITQPGRRPSL